MTIQSLKMDPPAGVSPDVAQEMTRQMTERLRMQMEQIEAALQRIEKGTFPGQGFFCGFFADFLVFLVIFGVFY